MARINQDNNEVNPYAPPLSADALKSNIIDENASYATLRKAHLHREAMARAIGRWFYLFALWNFVSTLPEAWMAIKARLWPVDLPELVSVLYPYTRLIAWGFATTCLYVALGFGVRHLINAARWGGVLVLALYLFTFCLATVGILTEHQLLGAFGAALLSASTGALLGVLLSPSTSAVFTAPYREAVSKTPGLKPRLDTAGTITCGMATAFFIGGIAITQLR
jgi:hypothetical protein